ncbi:phospholipase D-like domain-containing protein [Arthrobacter zhaoguopingii]|uniref:phospholipase D-like domain-containing protein n=1 Tax=Arthrobacter zhaoguopingii TaxID=2681491 RepID=UPI001FEE2471|nr:phospholipase D-like domain-containing protein [Arthrobacter zhaoguopingii]
MAPPSFLHPRGLRTVALRALGGFIAVQATVIAILIAADALKRRSRVRRSRFPRPGIFEHTVGDTGTRIHTYGEDLYRDMLAAIDGAQRRILMETYLWKNDGVGRQFRDALNAAAKRGVEVYLIYDGFGNLVVPSSFYRFHPAVHVFRFPVVRPRLLLTPLRATGLTHRKLLVVDDETGFIGGYNIGSLYATQWRDTHVRLTGPAAFELGHSFTALWNHPWGPQPKLPHSHLAAWNSQLHAVNNVPANLVYPIRSVYLDAIHRARDHIYLTTAYFIPDQQILTALIEAAQRGVDVRVIVPENSNHVLADWLSRGFYSALLAEGITLLLYRHAMIHAKTATIDGQWSIVGTANIDRLSLSFNYESNLIVHDPDFAADMEEIFATDSANCLELSSQMWERRHPAAWFAETVLRPLRPFL